MTRRTFPCLSLGVISAGWMAACQRTELTGPPTLRLGRDQCAQCGMMLSEDRCAGALLVERESERTHLIFDDIGCLLDYRAAHPEDIVIGSFVRDYGASQWLPTDGAWFLTGGPKAPATPMGSGIVAFGARQAAERQQIISGGEIAEQAAVSAARRRMQEAKSSGQ